MAKANETLKALLVSLNLCSEESAEAYSDKIEKAEAQKLLNLLQKSTGGVSQNLSDGQGGFLSGLKKIVNSRKLQNESDLTENPKALDVTFKNNNIKSHKRTLEKSDDEFLEGIKLLLKGRNEERLSKLSPWKSELSDEDFPRKLTKYSKEINKQNEELLKNLKKKLEDEAIDMDALLKKHRQ